MSLSDENLIIDCPVLSDAAPVVVGGVGGSGTRVIAQLLQSLDFDMGSDLNESLDDLGFTALFKRPSLWPLPDHISQLNEALEVYLTSRGHKSPSWISQAHQNARVAELLESIRQNNEWLETGSLSDREQFLAAFRQPTPLWGWKEPNAHILLPFLMAALPNMKYIHVTRHGLDMAHSSNQTQMKIWGPHLLGRAVDIDSSTDSLAFWCNSHRRLLELRKQFFNRVLVLPFESLFSKVDSTLTQLCKFLESPETFHSATIAAADLRQPQSLGRYRHHPPISLSSDDREILRHLNYTIEGYDCEQHRQ
ncbi:MAG: sulfotransferase [Luminiphilus sp.]|nr:sulfotransferase [Luminiphilus sp.]